MARILIIDDDRAIRTVLKRLLASAGHEVVEAFDGADGMQVLHQKPADLVITDIQMPRKSGTEVIADVRREFPDTGVMAMTASGGEGVSLLATMDVERVFVKPFRTKEVLEAVQDVIRKRRSSNDQHQPAAVEGWY